MLLIWGIGVALAAEGAVGLDYVSPTSITVPVSKLPAAPETIKVSGPFRLAGVLDGVRTYEAPLPLRPRALYYERQPLEMELQRGGRPIMYDADPLDRGIPGTWEINARSLMVRVRADGPRPDDTTYTLAYPPATEREEALRFRGGDATAWAIRSAQVDDVSRHGVLLPTGAEAAWKVTLPDGAHFRAELGVLPREIAADTEESDGADLDVVVDGTVVQTLRVTLGEFQKIDVPLPTSGGEHAIALRTHDPNPAWDAVFVASPSVVAPEAKHQKVVLAFIDTLRRDHLPTYGYERASAPKLDGWAKNAVVFDDARSIAPWTLPSTRAFWTGRQPEDWSAATTIQQALRKQGWATGAFVGNVYLSSNFDMDRGWGEHGCLNWPPAAYETWRARDFLRRHQDEDALVLVHFMDLHLPYKEPSRYRHLWAKADPNGLEELFNRTILMRVAEHQRELIRPYLIDRYDQNLRYVDDELSAFLGGLADDTTVVLMADHGEEFFDHGDVEHGHTLYDELLRVPLIVKSPGLTAARVKAPVSLMDVAPTLLELLGLPADTLGPSLEGSSLVALAKGGPDEAFVHRPLAIGRTLYGGVAWGSLKEGQKYISLKGREYLFDTHTDPGEQKDLAAFGGDVSPGRQALAEGTHRDVVQAFRISPVGRANKEILIDVQVPGGVATAWVGDDPTSVTIAEIRSVDGDFVHLAFESKLKDHREVFIVPNRPSEEVAGEVAVRIAGKMTSYERLSPHPNDGSGTPLGVVRSGSTSVAVTWAVLPVPAGDALVGSNGELTGALEALGYSQPIADDQDASGGSGGSGGSSGSGEAEPGQPADDPKN